MYEKKSFRVIHETSVSKLVVVTPHDPPPPVSGVPWPFLSVMLPPGESGSNEKQFCFLMCHNCCVQTPESIRYYSCDSCCVARSA